MSLSSIKCDLIKTITLRNYNGVENIHNETINTIQFPGVANGASYMGESASRQAISLKYYFSSYADIKILPKEFTLLLPEKLYHANILLM